MKQCEVHAEELGIDRPAVDHAYDQWLCEECLKDIALSVGAERQYQSQYAYACGYHD